jgi:hypothetical protein
MFKNSFEKTREKYLSKFKKPFEERTKSENIIVECLYNIEFLQKNSNIGRYLGAIETVLIYENVLNSCRSFNYLQKEHKFLCFKWNVKETYAEHIIRLGKEFLKQNKIL